MLVPSNSPVTTVGFSVFAGNFTAGSTFTLYGVAAQYPTNTPTAATLGAITDQAGFASVAFTPSANDNATSYLVSGTNAVTTYGDTSPIVVPITTVGSAANFNVSAVNSLGSTPSAISGGITSTNAFASIGTVYNSAAGGVTALFNNIPQHYKHLQIRMIGRAVSTSTTPPVYLNFNGDTAGNYNWHYLVGNGSTPAAGGAINYGDIEGFTVPHSTATANTFGAYIIDILDYADTSKFKTTRQTGGFDFNGSGQIHANSGAWRSFAPISQIAVQTYAGYGQYSHIALYGIS
jgi:hypothetical protein